MNIDPNVLDGIWRRIQNVCRTALEKSYPRFRLTNYLDHLHSCRIPGVDQQSEPIDLVSIKLNDVFVVCAKHPRSNLVRLGLHIPNVSLYNFVDLTESWFASGSHVRISEEKFLGLGEVRQDLIVTLVPRITMMTKDGRFYRESAFGYLICQLTHVFKDYNTASLSRETLKLILAEMQWRELYGTTPYDAFTNIVNHMAQYGEASDWYSEPSLPVNGEEPLDDDGIQPIDEDEYVFAEKHFYATIDPTDSDGKVISRISEPINLAEPPKPDVRLTCHFCKNVFESFDFAMHMATHVEHNRRENERKEFRKRRLIECKHCFKPFKRENIALHAAILKSHYQMVRYGCRICCIRLNDRVQYLQHMRRMHFEHETPYRCPSCRFASSFQRDVFIHFQEEHRHSLIILCPFCLRSFTVKRPDEMTRDRMHLLSKIVYNHFSDHFLVSKSYACTNCCLCFLDKDQMRRHKQLHHNPLEVRPLDQVKVQPFIVTADEEKFCVKAVPGELFIANKRPNMMDRADAGDSIGTASEHGAHSQPVAVGDRLDEANGDTDDRDGGAHRAASDDSDPGRRNPQADCLVVAVVDGPAPRQSQDLPVAATDRPVDGDAAPAAAADSGSDSSSESSESDADSFCTARDDGTILVRGLSEAEKFLAGAKPDMRVSNSKSVTGRPSATRYSDQVTQCTSQKLIEFLSKLKRADGVLANRSVILTPKSKPARCCECFEFITVDHYVATINCKTCRYSTHCPRALTKHKMTVHEAAQPVGGGAAADGDRPAGQVGLDANRMTSEKE